MTTEKYVSSLLVDINNRIYAENVYDTSHQQSNQEWINRSIIWLQNDYHVFSTITLLIVYIFLIIFGLLTNSSLITIIFFKQKLIKKKYLLITNLAITDTIFCLICSPITLYTTIYGSKSLNIIFYNFFNAFKLLLTLSTVFTISMMAIDRQIIITRKSNPITSSSTKCIIFIVAIWFVSLLIALPVFIKPSLYNYEHKNGLKNYDYHQQVNDDDDDDDDNGNDDIYFGNKFNFNLLFNGNFNNFILNLNHQTIYAFFLLLIQWLIPLCILSSTQLQIRNYLSKSFRNQSTTSAMIKHIQTDTGTSEVSNINRTESSLSNTEQSISDIINELNDKMTINNKNYNQLGTTFWRSKKRNDKASLFLLKVSLLFTVIWLPNSLIRIVINFLPTNQYDNLLINLCNILILLSPSFNSILYHWNNESIKRDLENYWISLVKLFAPKIRQKSHLTYI